MFSPTHTNTKIDSNTNTNMYCTFALTPDIQIVLSADQHLVHIYFHAHKYTNVYTYIQIQIQIHTEILSTKIWLR